MILVVDTNMLFAEAGLSGPLWAEVKQAVKDGVLQVIVPRIVAAEYAARADHQRRVYVPKRPPRSAGPEAQGAYEALAKQISDWLDSFDDTATLTAAGFQVLATPNVDHDALAQRAIDRKPPFNASGGGYRDAMHWHSLLAAAKANPAEKEIVLLSADGCYEDKGKIHPKLLDEAHSELEGRAVVLCRSFADFDIPGKYAGADETVEISVAEAEIVLNKLFSGGPVQSTDLWMSAGLVAAEDADLSDPSAVQVLSASQRPLAGGGLERHLRLQSRVQVSFDWSDSPTGPSLVELAVRYTIGADDEIHLAELVSSRFALDIDPLSEADAAALRRSISSILTPDAVERINRSFAEAFPQDFVERMARASAFTIPNDVVESVNRSFAAAAFRRDVFERFARAIALNTPPSVSRGSQSTEVESAGGSSEEEQRGDPRAEDTNDGGFNQLHAGE